MSTARPSRCCPHEALAHRHHRAGTDCSLCDCPRLRRRLLPWGFPARAGR